jgi:hypothetical protein
MSITLHFTPWHRRLDRVGKAIHAASVESRSLGPFKPLRAIPH